MQVMGKRIHSLARLYRCESSSCQSKVFTRYFWSFCCRWNSASCWV